MSPPLTLSSTALICYRLLPVFVSVRPSNRPDSFYPPLENDTQGHDALVAESKKASNSNFIVHKINTLAMNITNSRIPKRMETSIKQKFPKIFNLSLHRLSIIKAGDTQPRVNLMCSCQNLCDCLFWVLLTVWLPQVLARGMAASSPASNVVDLRSAVTIIKGNSPRVTFKAISVHRPVHFPFMSAHTCTLQHVHHAPCHVTAQLRHFSA